MEYRITLQQLLNGFPFTLTDAEHFQFIGNKRIFTAEEASSIKTAVQESRTKTEAELLEKQITDLAEQTKRKYKQREKATVSPISTERRASERCTAISKTALRKTCGNVLQDGGVAGSGFCEECWYPNIVDEYADYRQLRHQGLSREAAALQIGLPFTDNTDSTRHVVTAPHVNKSAAWAGSNRQVDKFPVVQFIELVKTQSPATPDEILTAMDEDNVSSANIQRDILMTNDEMASVDNESISTHIEC